MTSYFSAAFFLLFLPLAVAAYGALPRRARPWLLLAASYAFFWLLSGWMTAFILGSTVSVYGLGRALEAILARRRQAARQPGARKKEVRRRYQRYLRAVVALGVAVNLGALVALKYAAFLLSGANATLGALGIPAELGPAPSLGLPIGISFYTLQAISYLVDVYRGGVRADHHLGRVALFLCFFPQIMEGPICRYGQTAAALWAGKPLRARSVYQGTLRLLVGMGKKMILADRANALVKTVFDAYGSYDGGVVALAAVLYTFELYCDFSGTMDVALGMGRIFNVEMPENFRQPFFARTASEFWQRWHVTLGSWLRDYVFYPVSLSGPVKRLTGTARRVLGNRLGPVAAGSVALGCVWLANGLWHGAGAQYLFFGFYYFCIILAGGFAEPLAQRLCARAHVDRESAPYRALQHVRTLGIVVVGELIFRAPGLHAGAHMLRSLFGDFSLNALCDGTVLNLGLDKRDFAVLAVGAVALLALGLLREKGIEPLEAVWRRGAVVRWAACCLALAAVVVLGAYGAGYTPVDPLYAQF